MAVFTVGNKKYPYNLKLTERELNTLTIAMALLSIEDMELEAEEQNIDLSELDYGHLELFDVLSKKTGMYSQRIPSEVDEIEVM